MVDVFANDRLVYLQMQKTASTHIARVLSEVVGGKQHQQHIRLREEKRDRVVCASIRNPWAWYVSLWAYGCRKGGGVSGIYHRVTAEPPSNFELARDSMRALRATRRWPTEQLREGRSIQRRQRATRTDLWRPCYTHPDDVDAFRRWLALVMDPDRSHELLAPFGRTDLRRCQGLMAFRYFWLLTDDRTLLEVPGNVDSIEAVEHYDAKHTVHDDMIRIEHLEEDITRVLARASYDLTSVQTQKLAELCRSKTNESPHLPTASYYDDTSLDLVATREVFLAKKYEYVGPE